MQTNSTVPAKRLPRSYFLVSFLPIPAPSWDALGLKNLALRLVGEEADELAPATMVFFAVCQGREEEGANILLAELLALRAPSVFREKGKPAAFHLFGDDDKRVPLTELIAYDGAAEHVRTGKARLVTEGD